MKYSLTEELPGLFRIKSTRDIPEHSIKKGDLGGLVMSESVLSHDGSCWVEYGAVLGPDVRVTGNALVGGPETVIGGSVRIFGNAKVSGDVFINGKGKIFGRSRVSDCVSTGNLIVQDMGHVAGGVFTGSNTVSGAGTVLGGKLHDTLVTDDSEVISGNLTGVTVRGTTVISGNFHLLGRCEIDGVNAFMVNDPDLSKIFR